MLCLHEIEKAKTVEYLSESQSIARATHGDFETLDSRVASGLMKIIFWDFRKRSHRRRNSSGKSGSWQTNRMGDHRSFQLKNSKLIHSIQDGKKSSWRWQRHLMIRAWKTRVQAAQQSGSAEAEPTSYTKLKRMAVRYLEQQTRVTHFSSRDRLGEKATPVVATTSKTKENEEPHEEHEIVHDGPRRANVQVEKLAASRTIWEKETEQTGGGQPSANCSARPNDKQIQKVLLSRKDEVKVLICSEATEKNEIHPTSLMFSDREDFAVWGEDNSSESGTKGHSSKAWHHWWKREDYLACLSRNGHQNSCCRRFRVLDIKLETLGANRDQTRTIPVGSLSCQCWMKWNWWRKWNDHKCISNVRQASDNDTNVHDGYFG